MEEPPRYNDSQTSRTYNEDIYSCGFQNLHSFSMALGVVDGVFTISNIVDVDFFLWILTDKDGIDPKFFQK